jgi:hypothetical protein
MKELASGVAVGITVFGTVPYAVGMLRGRIRPHAFTWLIWTATTMIAFAGQLVGHGGIGAAAAGASAVVSVVISGYAFWRGERAYTRLDWLCLTGAAIALVTWGFAGGPLAAVILIAFVDAIGAVPTARKAAAKPEEEAISPFVLANLKWVLAIYALDHLNALTLVFPATTTAVNVSIITVVLVRRSEPQPRARDAARADADDRRRRPPVSHDAA